MQRTKPEAIRGPLGLVYQDGQWIIASYSRDVAAIAPSTGDDGLPETVLTATAKRLVECFNALMGVEDPEEFVRVAKESRSA